MAAVKLHVVLVVTRLGHLLGRHPAGATALFILKIPGLIVRQPITAMADRFDTSRYIDESLTT